MGNLTRDPEVKYLPKGTAVCEVSLAINRVWKDDSGAKKEEVTFISAEFFGRSAETIAQYCKKGQPIYIECRARIDSWEKDGKTIRKTKFVGENFQFLAAKQSAQGDSLRQDRNIPARLPAPKDPDLEDDLEDDSDSIPF